MSPRYGGAGHPAAALDEPPVSSATTLAVQTVLTLAPEPQSCALARRAVQAFCRTQGLEHLSDDATLLTSELVGNAVEHAGTTILLTAESSGGELTVRVDDDNARPLRINATDADSLGERGRGLQVVDSLAGDWGTTQQKCGKSVWFRLP